MAIADHFPRLRRLSPLILLLAAIVLYFGVVAPRAAEDHHVILELQGDVAVIDRVDLVWTGIDVHPDEAIGGAIFRFDSKPPPPRVRTTVHAPPGDYWLDVTMGRPGGAETVRRRISLGGGEIKIFVPVGKR